MSQWPQWSAGSTRESTRYFRSCIYPSDSTLVGVPKLFLLTGIYVQKPRNGRNQTTGERGLHANASYSLHIRNLQSFTFETLRYVPSPCFSVRHQRRCLWCMPSVVSPPHGRMFSIQWFLRAGPREPLANRISELLAFAPWIPSSSSGRTLGCKWVFSTTYC